MEKQRGMSLPLGALKFYRTSLPTGRMGDSWRSSGIRMSPRILKKRRYGMPLPNIITRSPLFPSSLNHLFPGNLSCFKFPTQNFLRSSDSSHLSNCPISPVLLFIFTFVTFFFIPPAPFFQRRQSNDAL